MNNIVFLIIDSARYDSFVKAKLKNIQKLGKIEKRYSYASWTSPSHYVLLMGLMPHILAQDLNYKMVFVPIFL